MKCVKVEKYCESAGAPALHSDFLSPWPQWCTSQSAKPKGKHRQATVTENVWRWHFIVAASPICGHNLLLIFNYYLLPRATKHTPMHKLQQILTFSLMLHFVCAHTNTQTTTRTLYIKPYDRSNSVQFCWNRQLLHLNFVIQSESVKYRKNTCLDLASDKE